MSTTSVEREQPRLAGPVTGKVRIGCSGWSYRDWRGRLYPDALPARRWFEHYATVFDTVELNSTFYRLPAPATVERWAAQAPPGFVYALKLGAFGSHRMTLRDAERWLPNHVDRACRLGPALGPTLVQLPPRWKRDVSRLDEFLRVATGARCPGRGPLRWALELRERSWLHDDVFEVLRRHGAALCLHDLLDDHPFVLTADWTYVRFHGPRAVAEPYRHRYGPHRLARWAGRLAELSHSGCDAYCYFNNDDEANAVQDARWLRDAVSRR